VLPLNAGRCRLVSRRGELRRIGIVSRGGACSWEQPCFREGGECIVWNEKESWPAGAARRGLPGVVDAAGLHAGHGPEHVEGFGPARSLAFCRGAEGRGSERGTRGRVPICPAKGWPEQEPRSPRFGSPDELPAGGGCRSRKSAVGDSVGCASGVVPNVDGPGAWLGAEHCASLREHCPALPSGVVCRWRVRPGGSDRGGHQCVPAAGIRPGVGRVGEGPGGRAAFGLAFPLSAGPHRLESGCVGSCGGWMALRDSAAPGNVRGGCAASARQL